MKNNLLLALNGVLTVAVIVLFVLFFTKNEHPTPSQPTTGSATVAETMPIAYINIDELLTNYEFSKTANESLIKKQEDARLTINTRARALQKEMEEFQRKLENNAFLSRDRAEQEHNRILKKQQELQELEAKLTQNIMEEQQKMSEQLRDTINSFLRNYNSDSRFQMILSNTANDNILLSADGYNITAEVISALNQQSGKK